MIGRTLAGLVLPAGLVAIAGCGQAVSDTRGPQALDPLVVYDTPVVRQVTDHQEFPGRVDAIYNVDVRARVSGYLKEVCFKDGDLVKKGDVLFRIDPRPFKATLDRAKATLDQAEAHAHRLNNEYRRAKLLFDQGRSISREEYDRYAFDHAEAEASLATAKANVDLAALDLEWTNVTADLPEGFTGRLSRRMVDPGNLIKAEDTMMTTMVTQDPLYIYFDVHEQAMLKITRLIQEGKVDPKKIPVDFALSDEQEFKHKGWVQFTDNKVDINTGTLRFRATVDNPDHLITPGLFVRVRLPIGDAHSAIMIREQAIQSDQGQKKVFVLKPKDDQGNPYILERVEKGQPVKIPAYKPVQVDIGTLGVLADGYREVQKGIAPGDFVVVVGMQKIRIVSEPKDPKQSNESKASKPPSNLVKARPFNPDTDAMTTATRGGASTSSSASLEGGAIKSLKGDAPAPNKSSQASHPAGGAAGGSERRPQSAAATRPAAKSPESRSGSDRPRR
jgi:RND family efflux transporter MFP subunit